MERKGLTLERWISLSQQMLKVFDGKIMAFQRLVIRMRENSSYLLSQIGNVGQTPSQGFGGCSHGVWLGLWRPSLLDRNRTFIEINTYLAVIPGGCMSVLQPLLMSVKSCSRTVLENYTNDGCCQKDKAVDWNGSTNTEHGTKIIAKGSLQTGIMTAFDGSGDDMLWVEDKDADGKGGSELLLESSLRLKMHEVTVTKMLHNVLYKR